MNLRHWFAAAAVLLSASSAVAQRQLMASPTCEELTIMDFLARLDGLGVKGEKVLLVDGLENLNLHLASRNCPELKMLDSLGLNAYEVLNHRWIVASESSVRRLVEVLS